MCSPASTLFVNPLGNTVPLVNCTILIYRCKYTIFWFIHRKVFDFESIILSSKKNLLYRLPLPQNHR